MRGLLIYSIFGSSLKGEIAFSMRRAKNCSTLDVLLRAISEAFLGSSTRSWRNRWLRSSMVQSKIVIGFFLQQTTHTAEKWRQWSAFPSRLVAWLWDQFIYLLFYWLQSSFSPCSFNFSPQTPAVQVRPNRISYRWTLGLFVFFLWDV